jgi:hypothetical protein
LKRNDNFAARRDIFFSVYKKKWIVHLFFKKKQVKRIDKFAARRDIVDWQTFFSLATPPRRETTKVSWKMIKIK